MELTCSFNIRRNLIWFCLISASRTGSEWASGVDSPIFTLPDYYSTQLFTAPCVWEVGTFWGLLSKLCSQAHSRQVTIWFVNCEMFASAHLFENCIVFNGLFVNCFYTQANKVFWGVYRNYPVHLSVHISCKRNPGPNSSKGDN